MNNGLSFYVYKSSSINLLRSSIKLTSLSLNIFTREALQTYFAFAFFRANYNLLIPFARLYLANSPKLSAITVGGGIHSSACAFVETPLNTNAVGHPTLCPAAMSVSSLSPTTSVSSFFVPSLSKDNSIKYGEGLPATIGSTPDADVMTDSHAPDPGISPRGVGKVRSVLVV